jgi:hypothetical protein
VEARAIFVQSVAGATDGTWVSARNSVPGSAGPSLAPESTPMPQRTVSPLFAGAVAALLLTVAGAWGFATYGAEAPRIVQVPRTRALLNDGACTFAAAVELRSGHDQWAFQRRQQVIRGALVALLRTKSRYMVSTPTAREALRVQMLREVNRVMGEPAADAVLITEFALS